MTTQAHCTCTTTGYCEPCRRDAIAFAKSKPILPSPRRVNRDLEPLPIPADFLIKPEGES